MPHVLIAGCGAAGMFAAVHAARTGCKVTVLDANDRAGHKLSITGKGRCNVTNACDRDTFLQYVARNPRFLYSALSRCAPADVCAFFEGEGVPLKTERGRRVFPQSDRAQDIVQALWQAMQRAGVTVHLDTRVKKLVLSDETCTGVLLADGTQMQADAVLLATGGMSYPRTGSRGDGYRLAEQAGHTVIAPQPSLIPLETAEHDPQEMQGLSLKNVTLTVTRGKKVIFSELGEMLFTHFGISGPLVLSASCRMEPEKLSDYLLTIDMKPALTAEQLDLRIQRDFAAQKNKDLANAMRGLLPSSMIPVMLKRAGIAQTQKVHDITKEQRRALDTAIKGFTLHASAMRPIAEAIVTRGGVSVKEVNPNTMESKKIRGLYFAGELLDVDAYTGGYNLQIAFATGFAAAAAIAERLHESADQPDGKE
ncbi:MAG: NAD(P)/FAD-dependent oxidoreductase [Oscillospiraceae bacterium]|nr:NAD(P)/FAD-dependent oxidoreductase [Oscillospiraceae bacterium]